MQGESDAMNATYASQYETNLTSFIGRVRHDFSMTVNAPFVIGRILRTWDTAIPGGNALVRSAQEAIHNQTGIGKVSWIDTDDLQLAYSGHYGTQGQIDLGIRFANEMVSIPEPSTLCLTLLSLVTVAIWIIWIAQYKKVSACVNGMWEDR